jgi:hypothetical protein
VRALLVIDPGERVAESGGVGVSLHHALREPQGLVQITQIIGRVVPGQVVGGNHQIRINLKRLAVAVHSRLTITPAVFEQTYERQAGRFV